MGQVFLAKNLEQDRLVAIKTLISTYDNDKEAVGRFLREFKLLSTLRHDGVVNVYSLATDYKGNPYAVCEYVDGIDLRKILAREGPLSWQEVLDITKQIAITVTFVHESGVVHHDIKPDNILIVEEKGIRRAKLLDFGLSRLSEASEEQTKLTWTGQLVGSPHYMAPEQLQQRGDKRSDIYSLGCVAFELLSGEIPFNADMPIAILWQRSHSAAETALGGLTAYVPKGLFLLLLRMLATDPSERYQSMAEVAEDIESIVKEPGPERSMSAWTRESAKEKGSKNRIGQITLALILTSIIGGTIVLFFPRMSRKKVPPLPKVESISSLEIKAINQYKSGDKEKSFRTFEEAIALLRKDPKRMASNYPTLYTAANYTSNYYESARRPEMAAAILSFTNDYCRLAAQRKDSSRYPECAAIEFSIAKELPEREKMIRKRIMQSSDTWGCAAPPTVDCVTAGILALVKANDRQAATALSKILEGCKETIPKNSYPHLKFLCATSLMNATNGRASESLRDARLVLGILESGDNFLTLNQTVSLFHELSAPLGKIGRQDVFVEKASKLLSTKKYEFEADPKLGQTLCNAISESYSAMGKKRWALQYGMQSSEFATKAKGMPRHKWLPKQ